MSTASEILTQLWFKLDEQHKQTLDLLETAKPYEVSHLCGRLDQQEQTCRDITDLLRQIYDCLDNHSVAGNDGDNLVNSTDTRGSYGS